MGGERINRSLTVVRFGNGGSWTGPNGFSSAARVVYGVPLLSGSNNYVLTYTNVDGVRQQPVVHHHRQPGRRPPGGGGHAPWVRGRYGWILALNWSLKESPG